jgi:uncharacterized protein YbjQ (UPF0145 family)
LSDAKKDLTRIEDLGEYLHELSQEDATNLEDSPPEFLEAETETKSEDFSSEDHSSAENFESTFSDNSSESFQTEEDFSNIDFSQTQEVSTEDSFQVNEDVSFSENLEAFSSTEDTPQESDLSFSPDSNQDEESSDTFEIETKEEFDNPEPEVFTEEKTQEIPIQESESFKNHSVVPEEFKDLQKFAENTSLTGMAAEGNPSFSVLISGIKFIEDAEDIYILLKELGITSDPEDVVKKRLHRGNFLIPRISEYAAIFLTHKLRRFDIDLQMGLSDDIHPPKHGERPETGLVSKHNLYQNQSHQFHFSDPKLEISQIVISSTSSLEGYQILKYIGVATEYHLVDQHIMEDDTSPETPKIYNELASKLKAHALKANANAVVGINYQITPIPQELNSLSIRYRLSCTGNLVWVNKL